MSSEFSSRSHAHGAPNGTKIALVVLRNDQMDGRLLRQSSALKKAGYDVKIFPVLAHNKPISTHLISRRVLRPIAYRQRKYKILNQIRRFAPDLILAHEPEALDLAAHYLDRANVPLVYDAHEFYEEQILATQDRIMWLRKTYAKVAPKVSALLTVSPGLKTLYQTHHPAFPEAELIFNAPEPIALGTYDGRMHAALSLSPDTKILLYQGGIFAGRGLSEMVHASDHLPENWVTVFMGYGELKHVIPNGNRLYTLDAVPNHELLFWTQGASLGAIPYPGRTANHIYCLPNKLWEYPLAGVPILSNHLIDIAAVLEQWKIGKTYNADGNGEALAAAIAQISDQDLLEMKANCATFSVTENWHIYQKKFLSVIRSCLKN